MIAAFAAVRSPLNPAPAVANARLWKVPPHLRDFPRFVSVRPIRVPDQSVDGEYERAALASTGAAQVSGISTRRFDHDVHRSRAGDHIARKLYFQLLGTDHGSAQWGGVDENFRSGYELASVNRQFRSRLHLGKSDGAWRKRSNQRRGPRTAAQRVKGVITSREEQQGRQARKGQAGKGQTELTRLHTSYSFEMGTRLVVGADNSRGRDRKLAVTRSAVAWPKPKHSAVFVQVRAFPGI